MPETQTQPTSPQKHLHPRIWISVLVLFAAAIGYLIWARESKEWPFEGEQNQEIRITPPAGEAGNQGEKQDETANWQTYRNEEYGFEFRYSNKYQQVPSDSQNVFLLSSENDAKIWDIRMAWYVQNTNKKSVYEFGNIPNSQYIKIGPQDAIRVVSNIPDSLEVGFVLIDNGKEFDIQVMNRSMEAFNDVDQILSTFKFIK